MSQFVHLHLHSQYSLLDGANRLDDVLGAAAEADMPALALTDHGNLYGAVEFYLKARKMGVKPILGMEAYVAQGDMRQRDPARGRSNHLVLLARDETGYRNLIKLTTRAFLEGFYYKPRVDKELLRQHSEGLIALSGCLKGEIPERIVSRQVEVAEATALELREIFGERDFYLELQDHGIPAQREVNEALRRIGRRNGMGLVVTNDTHYLRRNDAFAHDVLLCVGTQKSLDDPDRMRYVGEEFYLKSADEMYAVFPDDRRALENTLEIAERCNLEIPFGEFHLPRFPVPAGYDLNSYLEHVAREGLERRLEQRGRRGARRAERLPEDTYRERLEVELGTIERMGFPGYFLIVWDFVRYAKERGIPVGPGRGSAAGSLVSYALGITDIDPLEYGLLFERFLNPERISMPDIDIDFCMRRRGEVIQYVNEKYGRDRVAQIITFGTLAAKAVIRDVGRVMGLPYPQVDRIAKLVPDMTRSLETAARDDPGLAAEVRRDPRVRQIIEVGTKLEGLARHASMHAAGVVIAPRPIEELVPLCKLSKDEILTQWDMNAIERLGLLKMDFLGLRTLTVIDDTLQTLRHQGHELDLDDLPLDDEEVFRLFCEGRTSGIFQFESGGMKELLRQACPTKFEDLAALNALYRPGALTAGMVTEFVKRKQGQRRVRYVLAETRPILEETYGVIAYQEQVMRIAEEVAGFTRGEADVLRKAMGKKKARVMAKQKEKFLDGAERRGVPRRKARELWDHIEPFAGYGFNKSHAVAYAMLAYKTAYLKAHHPVAFMAAMLTSEMSDKDDVAKYIHECGEMGISVLPPDVNESGWAFTAVGDHIRFGLGAVKGIGKGAVEAILEARQRVGRFRSLAHLATETDLGAVNHKVFECLIKSGALDAFAPHRRALWESLDAILDFAHRRRKERAEGQGVLFAASALGEPGPDTSLSPWSRAEILRAEKEALGFFLSGNPLEQYASLLEGRTTHTTAQLKEEADGTVRTAGVVARVRKSKIKSRANAGRLLGRFELEDLHGSSTVILFPDILQKFGSLVREDALVLVTGQLRPRGGEVEVVAERVESLESFAAPSRQEVEIRLRSDIPVATLLGLRDLLVEHAGETPVVFRLPTAEGEVRITPAERFKVKCQEGLVRSVEQLLGHGCSCLVHQTQGFEHPEP